MRLLLLLVVACGGRPAPRSSAGVPAEDPLAASIRAAMDPSVDPCVDFYQYACGGWLRSTPIPADRPSVSRGFSSIEDRNLVELRRLAEQAARGDSDAPGAREVGAFYGACMDEAHIEARGLEPLRPLLARVAAIDSTEALMEQMGELLMVWSEPLFFTYVSPDRKDPDEAILYVTQGGMGLPDRDYYLLPENAELLAKYEAHVAAMFALIGQPPDQAAASAATVLAFETALARAALPREDTRHADATYHPVDRAGLQAMTPNLPWDAFFRGAGYPDVDRISVGMPSFMVAADTLVHEASMDDLRAYVTWRLVSAITPALPAALEQETFSFFYQTLYGQEELPPRWKRCLRWTDEAVGDALGQLWIDAAFPGDSKEIAVDMIERVERSMAEGIAALTWMDPVTAERARDKMGSIRNKIGYPDTMASYDDLVLSPRDHFANVLAGRVGVSRDYMDRIGRPVDPDRWYMSAPTVNAYYDPAENGIVFPAGILQPPFFDRTYPQAINYGAMGMVMAHEVTHGFDDAGRKFDATGAMTDWWEPDAVTRFEERAQCVRDLYATYEIKPGFPVNGVFTAGENIADMGGIKHAFGGYQSWVADHGPEAPMAGLTADQLFFVGFAQAWCTNHKPELQELLLTTDQHSPSRFRVNGPLSQLPAFGETFGCEVGAPMRPAAVCEVW